MKKIALLLAILLILGCVSGCTASASTQEDDGALQQQVADLQEENATLKQQVADLQEENSSLQQQIEDLQKPVEDASSAENTADDKAQESEEPSVSEVPVEEAAPDAEVFDVSETEIRGGTNQADAMQLPMNTKVYGTLHDAQNMYLSFHTSSSANSLYQITVINKTPMDDDRGRIGIYVFDELGTEIADGSAYDSGIASTLSVEGLSPDTDYYIRLIVQNRGNDGTRGDTARFAIIIRDTNTQVAGVNTTNNLVDSIVPPNDITSLVVGTNQDDSALIPFDKTVSGELKDALGGWFAFATDDSVESSYLISVVNKSVEDSLRIGIYVFDEFGTEVVADSAYSDGITKAITLDGLQPCTVYYIRLIVQNRGNDGTRGDTVGYALTVRCQNNTPEANTATVEDAEEVVFETPFELSSTQVRFVADQAVFINENEAKEALAPVAEIILAHPEHPILLAGTTATYGAQESCVNLSNRRAAAVKDLLVNYFGVPESQLITVGLGYEADPFVRGRDVDSNGNFVESEGAKNRRVVVLDAESDIARQILGN